jgi:hypothetical protein
MAHDTQELVSAYKASGLTQKRFCVERGIAPSALQYHLAKVRRQSPESDAQGSSEMSNGCFIPLRTPSSSSATRTIVVVHGQIATSEIAELVQAVVR